MRYFQLIIILSLAINPTCISQTNVSANKTLDLTGPYLGQSLPGNIPEIFAISIVSTDMYNHSSIAIAPDGNEIFWAMAPLDSPRRIYSSKRINYRWSKPEIIQFTVLEDGDCPVLSGDGNKMFFNSNRTGNGLDSRRERIWCVERVNGEWGDPYPLGEKINAGHLHWQVSVDNKGNLYFGSEREGSKGKDDIFFAEYNNGKYMKPISMGDEINSAEHESTPFVSPDGEYMIFARNGLWISFKDDDTNWTKAISMGKELDGICPYVSPDSKFLFFLKMSMGINDVYWVSAKVIDDLRDKISEWNSADSIKSSR